ncbi:uncharacterized protein LOC120349798 isoform X2 [Nilaparvata lugens]|nr:uncharacterized protein LOC120349798 isoform X2 [Nilaparvata lugens]
MAVRAALQLGGQCPWTPGVLRAVVRALSLYAMGGVLGLAGDVVQLLSAFCGARCNFSLDILGGCSYLAWKWVYGLQSAAGILWCEVRTSGPLEWRYMGVSPARHLPSLKSPMWAPGSGVDLP